MVVIEIIITGNTLKNINYIFLVVLLIKLFFFDLVNHLVVLYRAKNAIKKFIEAILKVMNYCKNVIKNNFNKNLVMSPEDED